MMSKLRRAVNALPDRCATLPSYSKYHDMAQTLCGETSLRLARTTTDSDDKLDEVSDSVDGLSKSDESETDEDAGALFGDLVIMG